MTYVEIHIQVKMFKNGPSKIYERQPLKNFTWSILEYLDLFDACNDSFSETIFKIQQL